MFRKTNSKNTLNRLHHAVCVAALLISLATLPAYAQQVHQLFYNNSYWSDQDPNGAQSLSGGPVAAFLTTPNDQTHAYFLASNNHVHQLFYNGTSWADEDLTTLSGGPTATGPVTGFSVGNYQYVYYVSQNSPQDVHQLLYNNAGWVDSDLTVLSKAKVTANNFYGLVAFTTSPTLHVYYQQTGSGDIHQLYSNNGATWQDQELTQLTGAPKPFVLWSGFNIGNLQYLYYQDSSYDLHQLYYNNSSWSDSDLTVSSKSPRPSVYPEYAFVIPGTKKRRIYYLNNTNGHLVQLATSNGKSWTNKDLTKKSKGPAPDFDSSILAYATTPNDQVHVFYETGNHIDHIFQPTPTTW